MLNINVRYVIADASMNWGLGSVYDRFLWSSTYIYTHMALCQSCNVVINWNITTDLLLNKHSLWKWDLTTIFHKSENNGVNWN